MSDSTMAVSSKYTQDLSVQIVFFTFSCKWFLCFYFWAVIWSYIVDLFAALHELASASAPTLLKLASSVRALLKPYGDTLTKLFQWIVTQFCLKFCELLLQTINTPPFLVQLFRQPGFNVAFYGGIFLMKFHRWNSSLFNWRRSVVFLVGAFLGVQFTLDDVEDSNLLAQLSFPFSSTILFLEYSFAIFSAYSLVLHTNYVW